MKLVSNVRVNPTLNIIELQRCQDIQPLLFGFHWLLREQPATSPRLASSGLSCLNWRECGAGGIPLNHAERTRLNLCCWQWIKVEQRVVL